MWGILDRGEIMNITITQITTNRFKISSNVGSFIYEVDGDIIRILLYALPQNGSVSQEDFLDLALGCIALWKNQDYQYIVSSEIQNPNVIKGLAKIDGIRFFNGFEEVPRETFYDLEPNVISFDCSSKYQGERIGPYHISIPLNGQAYPPFTWFEYDPNTGKVLRTFYEKPENCKYCYATNVFKVGDEMFNDHYFDPDRKCIYYSCKRHDVLEQEEHNEPPSINNNEQR